jgi:hypothetical protein
MASDKRERQRANRAVRRKAESKTARTERIIGLTKRVTWWVVGIAALLILANVVWG